MKAKKRFTMKQVWDETEKYKELGFLPRSQRRALAKELLKKVNKG